MGAGVHADGSVSWHKIGVFVPKLDAKGAVTEIIHQPSSTNGKISAEDKFDASWHMKMNHSEAKAVFTKGALKAPVAGSFH